MMDDCLQPSRAPSVGGEVRFETLGEDLCPALRSDAQEPADADRDDDASAGDREIQQGPGTTQRTYPKRDEARMCVLDFIECFYNAARRH